ncbi:Putative glycosyltransferase EpsH [Arthrobacter saudimassiliensis]|uniref:Putative glycosyltransferase EpsH n=1 Tax=Arthrobacter saudimassiliensis TaxID=1461584 RepID=A0A078MSQ8_9MICC|nr:Putative glycosyltransferase EpsH [Arthrobacter saudimassiliensis]
MARGQFSLVVAVHNVAEYLPAFLESLLRQRYPMEDLDIVMVDDGSTDGSGDLIAAWNTRHRAGVRLVRQPNAGPGAARNTGLALANGEWVTFCDPDDILHPSYFRAVEAFLATDVSARAQLLATRLVQFQDGTAQMSHRHPLGRKFRYGNMLVDLDENPECIQLHGPTAFLRRRVLQDHGLRFEERLRPKFEDSHLIGRYLAAVGAPVIGIVADARYLYRRNRRRGASLVAGAWADPRAYDELPRLGYLGLLEAVRDRLGRIPAWAHYMVLYDLVWFYIDDKRMHSRTAGASAEQQATMHRWLERIVALIDDPVIDSFGVVSQGWIFHHILLLHYRRRQEGPPTVQQWETDHDRGTTRYSYLFEGETPEEKVFMDGRPVEPVATKIRDHKVLGRTLIRERILILPAGIRPEFVLSGTAVEPTTDRGVPFPASERPRRRPDLVLAQPRPEPPAARRLRSLHDRVTVRSLLTGAPQALAAWDTARRTATRPARRLADGRRRAADRALTRQAAREPAVSRYRSAWVLMDRIDRADDNAEHLYRYLMRNKPDVNAWFLLARDSPDWDRLEHEGFRLVPYGSAAAVPLVLNADFVLSSHLNANIHDPIGRRRFGDDRARFVFLQHGIIKDDLSRWLNQKDIALMITASLGEHESITGGGSEYVLTSQEVRLTGFPRHDALLQAAREHPPHLRRNILIAPTWREYLRDELADHPTATQRRTLFETSEFGRNWLPLLRSDRLAEYCRTNGYRLVLLPHPELEPFIPLLNLPDHIQLRAYHDGSVQEELVNARLLLTDYSSIAFDAAHGGAKVVYLQFDPETIYTGGHIYRRGYFDYLRDGFGPVTATAEEAVAAIIDAAADEPRYAERRRATFAFTDTQSCARVAAAIEALRAPGRAEGR